MDTYIKIAIENDARWRIVKDGVLQEFYGTIGDADVTDSLAKKSNAVAYARSPQSSKGTHLFFCTTKMDASYPRLFARLSDKDVGNFFDGRIINQLVAPPWFTNLERNPNRKYTVFTNLQDFSKWVRHGDDVDAWVKPKFGMSLLAKIVDKLLIALKKSKKAHIVLSYNEKNIEDAQRLLYYSLRCLPRKLSNKFTFNTAASATISPFDICCGNFTKGAFNNVDGEFIDVEKALSNDADGTESNLVNPYAYYISMLNGEIDPCAEYSDVDTLDVLNAKVNEKVLEYRGGKLVEKCRSNSLTVEDLKNFTDDVQSVPEGRVNVNAYRLSELASYIFINYTGFVKICNSDKFSKKYKDFYLKHCVANYTVNVEETDSLFKQNSDKIRFPLLNNRDNSQKGNCEYIKNLYAFWSGTKSNKSYISDETIGSFLFSDFDKRFKDNANLRQAFIDYWKTLSDDDFLKYLSDSKPAKSIEDYILMRKSNETPSQFVNFCCRLKNVLPEETVSNICNKHLYSRIHMVKSVTEESVNDLLSAKKTAESNGIELTDDVKNAITEQIKEEIKRKRQVAPPDKFIEYCRQLKYNKVLLDYDYINQVCKEYLLDLCRNIETTTDKFVEYCCQFKTGKLLSEKTVSSICEEYLSNLCDANKTTSDEFVDYCCQFKTAKLLSEKTVNDICNKYFLNLSNQQVKSVDNLLSAKKTAESNGIELEYDVIQTIKCQVKKVIKRKRQSEDPITFIEYCRQLKTNDILTAGDINEICKEYLLDLCRNNETTTDKFVDYCCQFKTAKLLSEKTVSSICEEYLSNLCDANKTTSDEFVEYCCQFKTAKLLPEKTVNDICNKYFLNLPNQQVKSVDNLLSAKKTAESNGIELTDDVKNAITEQIKEEIELKRQSEDPITFIKYCCELKTDKVLSEETVSKTCNDYLSNLCKRQEKSVDKVDNLLSAKKTAEDNGIELTDEVKNAIEQKAEEKNNEKCQQEVVQVLSQSIKIEGIEKTKRKDKRIATKRINELAKKCADKNERKDILSKKKNDVVVYNSARLHERDYGKSGTKKTANYYGKLIIFSVLVVSLFASAMVMLLTTDMLLLNKLYIFGWKFWVECIITLSAFLAGIIIWFIFELKTYREYKENSCNKNNFESESTKMLKLLFGLCVCATFLKVILAILFIFVL